MPLLIVAERDQDTLLFRAQVFGKLVNVPYKRHLIIGEGTHTVALATNRMHLINQIQGFLDEQNSRKTM